MAGLNDKFSRKHEEAIAALLSTTSVMQAAQQAGVSQRTLRRWLQRDDFQAAYRRARRELVNGAIHVLLHATGTATTVLVDIMNDHTAPATARVSAARTVLNLVLRSLAEEDVEFSLADVERILAERNGHHG